MMETDEARDLGIFITSDLKPSLQCVKAANKAMSVLGMVRRNFKRLDVEGFRIIYKGHTRPHLEYCIQAWSPFLVKDKLVLENAQRRATKLVRGLKNFSYEERLQILGLTTLEKRRLRGDLIETYKILTGKDDINYGHLFTLESSDYDLRGHQLKLFKHHNRLNVRKFFFTQRVISAWNSLPSFIVDESSVNSFKRKLDDFWKDMGN